MALSKHLGKEEQNKNEAIVKLFLTEDKWFLLIKQVAI